jgi:hypothetical protein
VIRSTVSVMFVLNVDELIFESCCPGNIQSDVRETEYLIPKVKISESTLNTAIHYYVLYIHLLLLTSLATAIVFVVRSLIYTILLKVLCRTCCQHLPTMPYFKPHTDNKLRDTRLSECMPACSDGMATCLTPRCSLCRFNVLGCDTHAFFQDFEAAKLLSSY